jgi:hypothetical protein
MASARAPGYVLPDLRFSPRIEASNLTRRPSAASRAAASAASLAVRAGLGQLSLQAYKPALDQGDDFPSFWRHSEMDVRIAF